MKIILPIITMFLGYISFGQSKKEINNDSINSFNSNTTILNTAEKQKSVIDYMNHFIMKDTSWFIDHIIPLNYFVESLIKTSDMKVQEYFDWEINWEYSDLVNCCYDSIHQKFIHKNYENEMLKTLIEYWRLFDTSTVYKIGETNEQFEINNEYFQSFDFYAVEFTSKSKTFKVDIPKFVIRANDSKVYFLKPPPQIGLIQVGDGFDATFVGGEEKLYSFIHNNLKYPKEMQSWSKEGIVEVEIVISDKGIIKQYKIKRSLSKEADKEVLILIKNMPKWNPGVKDGKPVESTITIPIRFSLGN